MFRIYTLVLTLLFTANLSAQNILGTVYDQTGEPLPGVSIKVEGTDNGAVSDSDGFFIIRQLEAGTYEIVASYVGFQTAKQTVTIPNNQDQIEFKLAEANYDISTIEVAGNWADEKTPMTYTNLNKEQIEQQNLGQDVPFLLRWTPSAVVTSDAGTGIGYTGIRIRGSDPSRTNVSINGIPLNDAESQGVFWVDLPDFASSTSQIQIQRGVGTSTNGAGAFGATVNLNTNKINTKPYAKINTTLGSFNTLKANITAGSGLINDKFTVDGRVSRITSDGYIDRAEATLNSFFVSGAYLGKDQSLRANIFSGHEITYQAWNGVPAQYIDNDSLRTYNSAGTEKSGEPHDNEVDDYTQTHYQLLYNKVFNDNWNTDLAFHYTRGKGFFEQYKADEDLIDYLLSEDENETSDLIRRRWLDNHFYGVTYAFNYQPTDQKYVFTLGGAWNQYKGGHYGETIWTAAAGDISNSPRYYDNDATKDDFNIFCKLNYQFTSKINAYLDLQYRNVNYEFLGFDNDGTNVTQDDNLNFFNPKLGLVYTPKSGQRLYASFAVSNREPNRSDYTESTPADRPKHETLYNTELGFRQQFSSRGFVGINGYLMDYNNQLALTGQLNDVGEYTRRNIKDSYRLGIELEGAYAITKGLQINANLTLSQNKIKEFTEFIDNWDYWYQDFDNIPVEELDPLQFQNQLEDTDLAFSPNIIFGGELSYDFLTTKDNQSLVLGLMNKYVGKQFIDNTSNDNTALDAYFFSDLRLAYELSNTLFNQIKLTVLVRNLWGSRFSTNAWTYRYRSLGYDARPDDPSARLENATTGTYNLTGFYPQAERNVLVGLTIGF